MFVIEYNDIELLWHGPVPASHQATIERDIRAHLRKVPLTPLQVFGGHFFIASGALIYIFGRADSDAFHCMCLL